VHSRPEACAESACVDQGSQAAVAARAGAGGEDEVVPVEALCADDRLMTADAFDACGESELDVEPQPVLAGPEFDVVAFAGEKFLREGGSFVRRVWLVAGQNDSSVEPEGAECFGGAGAG
jgi:hypothetical protein